MVKRFLYFAFVLFLVACGKNREENTHREGEMVIYADPSNRNVLEALTEIYQMKFPKVEFKIIYQPENQVLKNLVDTVAYAAFINQGLDEKQTAYIKQLTDVTPRSTLLAHDAVVFITAKNNPLEALSLPEIKTAILEDTHQIVFDNGNSGNFNTVQQVLDLKIPEGKNVQALGDALAVVEFLQQSKNAIGVIGLNEISEKDNPQSEAILEKVKILSIVDENNQVIAPSVPNILALKYPFSKGIYFIVREPGFGIGNGFSRFAGSQQGQLIIGRAGLQPHFLYERQVQVNSQSIE